MRERRSMWYFQEEEFSNEGETYDLTALAWIGFDKEQIKIQLKPSQNCG